MRQIGRAIPPPGHPGPRRARRPRAYHGPRQPSQVGSTGAGQGSSPPTTESGGAPGSRWHGGETCTWRTAHKRPQDAILEGVSPGGYFPLPCDVSRLYGLPRGLAVPLLRYLRHTALCFPHIPLVRRKRSDIPPEPTPRKEHRSSSCQVRRSRPVGIGAQRRRLTAGGSEGARLLAARGGEVAKSGHTTLAHRSRAQACGTGVFRSPSVRISCELI